MDASIEIFAFRLGYPPSVTQQALAWRRILRGDPCSYCGAESRQADHIHASWMGGEHEWTNLTASCRRCNQTKGSRSLLAFLSGEGVGGDHRTKAAERLAAYYARMAA